MSSTKNVTGKYFTLQKALVGDVINMTLIIKNNTVTDIF